MSPPHPAGRLSWFGRTLDFELQLQEQGLWCWAACASAISKYFDRRSSWTQCATAGAVLGRPDCCTNGTACNRKALVYQALELTGNLGSRIAQPVGWYELVAELRRGRPVVVRIEYPHLGHFVVVDGYRFGRRLRVRDPKDGSIREISFAALRRSYNGFGWWSHTYLTCE